MCNKPLCSQNHICPLPCHLGSCPPCPEPVIQYCYCGQKHQIGTCGTLDIDENHSLDEYAADRRVSLDPTASDEILPRGYSCKNVCGKKLSCGQHFCQDLCHKGNCTPCVINSQKTCPCGKNQISDLISQKFSCKMQIPLCNKVCYKMLQCGHHRCLKQCHHGQCPPCTIPTYVTCRCGSSVKPQPLSCSQVYQYRAKISHIVLHKLKPHQNIDSSIQHSAGDSQTQATALDLEIAKFLISSGMAEPLVLSKANADHLAADLFTLICSLPPLFTCKKSCSTLRNCSRHQCSTVCCPVFGFHTLKDTPDFETTGIQYKRSMKRKRQQKSRKLVHKVPGSNPSAPIQAPIIDLYLSVLQSVSLMSGSPANSLIDMLSLHDCGLPCQRELNCKKHKCHKSCHRGVCGKCPEYTHTEISCQCGKTKLLPPISCGTVLPSCTEQCPLPRSCKHPSNHFCHFSTTTCPPCKFLIPKMCLGGHKSIDISCKDFDKPVRCASPCGVSLGCDGHHLCILRCHDHSKWTFGDQIDLNAAAFKILDSFKIPQSYKTEIFKGLILSKNQVAPQVLPSPKKSSKSAKKSRPSWMTDVFGSSGPSGPSDSSNRSNGGSETLSKLNKDPELPKHKLTDIVPVVCCIPCQKLLGCGHLCPQICHSDPCAKCQTQVIRLCKCGRKTFSIPCGYLLNESPMVQFAECDTKCKKLARNKQLADAFGISLSKPSSSSIILPPDRVKFPWFSKSLCTKVGRMDFILEIERIFDDFLNFGNDQQKLKPDNSQSISMIAPSNADMYSFFPMPPVKRQIIRELAGLYGFYITEVDPEPNRYVSIQRSTETTRPPFLFSEISQLIYMIPDEIAEQLVELSHKFYAVVQDLIPIVLTNLPETATQPEIIQALFLDLPHIESNQYFLKKLGRPQNAVQLTNDWLLICLERHVATEILSSNHPLLFSAKMKAGSACSIRPWGWRNAQGGFEAPSLSKKQKVRLAEITGIKLPSEEDLDKIDKPETFIVAPSIAEKFTIGTENRYAQMKTHSIHSDSDSDDAS